MTINRMVSKINSIMWLFIYIQMLVLALLHGPKGTQNWVVLLEFVVRIYGYKIWVERDEQ